MPPASRLEELCKALIPLWQAPQCGTEGSHALTSPGLSGSLPFSPSLGTFPSPTSNGLLSGTLYTVPASWLCSNYPLFAGGWGPS